MSTNEVLDAYASFRRELALIRANLVRDLDLGHTQVSILWKLSKSVATMGDLAVFTVSDKASITRAVASLERAGLVKRVTDPNDKRVSLVELTAKGRGKAERVEVLRSQLSEQINGALVEAERSELARLLQKIANQLQEKRK